MFKLFFTMVMAIIAATFIIGFIVKSLRKGRGDEFRKITDDISITQKDNSDKIKKLQELAKLREQNILTEDEFEEQKKKILNY